MSLHKYPADISKYHPVNITGFSISYVMWLGPTISVYRRQIFTLQCIITLFLCYGA